MEVGLHEETAAFAFGEEEFSDVELVFVQEQSQAAEQEDMEPQVQPPTTKRGNSAKRPREVLERSSSLDQKQQPQQDAVILHRLPGHALVLASHSEFFKVALSQRWRREGQGKLEIPCNGSEDFEAAQKVIKIMYTRKFDLETLRVQQSGGKQPNLVQLLTKMVAWADRWQAGGCVDLCLASLARMGVATPTVQDVNALFALPGSVNEKTIFASIQSLRKKWLAALFGDVYAVITKEEMLKAFCTLSLPAVDAWAGLNELAVHTENDVAVLLTLWCTEEIGQKCSEDELAQLGQALRVGNLTPMFRRLILPELEWFEEHVREMNLFVAMLENKGAMITADAIADSEFPDAWSAASRQGILPPGASDRATMTVQVPETELKRMLNEDAARVYNNIGCSAYWHGYYWHVNISLNEGKFGGEIDSTNIYPFPIARCIKYTCKVNGAIYDSYFLREKGARLDLFSELGAISSLTQLKSRMSNGRLEVRFELTEIS